MALPKISVSKVVIEYSNGSIETFQNTRPIICIDEKEYRKLLQFYQNYSKIIKSIRDDKSINALCELQRGINVSD